jgi:1-phosphofructokinase
MIYTVTFNPALDYTLWLDSLEAGRIQNSVFESCVAGGKGINVSNVLTRLGAPNVALGFIAGFTGDEIERQVRSWGMDCGFIRLPGGASRINVKIRTAPGAAAGAASRDTSCPFGAGPSGIVTETDINARGPVIDADELGELYGRLAGLNCGDYLILSGSVPAPLPDDIYEKALVKVSGMGVNCVVDAAGALLRSTLKHRPFLIKPNKEELGALFGREIGSDADLRECAEKLQSEGAANVLVSKGGDGAALLTETGEFIAMAAPHGKPVSTVGAGDSMVAGFVAGWLEYGDYAKALAMGTAAGAATAFSEGIASRDGILAQFARL